MTKKQRHEIPLPVIDGFLEVVIASAYSGVAINDEVTSMLSMIWHNERKHAERKKTSEDRRAQAYHNLGKMAALRALYNEEGTGEAERFIGFGLPSDNDPSAGQ